MDAGRHVNLPPDGLASAAAPRSLMERRQTYNPWTARKDYPSPRTPHQEQEQPFSRRFETLRLGEVETIQIRRNKSSALECTLAESALALTSMQKIRAVPRSYRALAESKGKQTPSPRDRTSKVPRAGRSRTLSAQDGALPRTPHKDEEQSFSRRLDKMRTPRSSYDLLQRWDEIRRQHVLECKLAEWALAESTGKHTPVPGDLTSKSSPRGEGKTRSQATDDQGENNPRDMIPPPESGILTARARYEYNPEDTQKRDVRASRQDNQEFTEFSNVLYEDLKHKPVAYRFARTTGLGITSDAIDCKDSPPRPKNAGVATVTCITAPYCTYHSTPSQHGEPSPSSFGTGARRVRGSSSRHHGGHGSYCGYTYQF